jgi:hypothetical protein
MSFVIKTILGMNGVHSVVSSQEGMYVVENFIGPRVMSKHSVPDVNEAIRLAEDFATISYSSGSEQLLNG